VFSATLILLRLRLGAGADGGGRSSTVFALLLLLFWHRNWAHSLAKEIIATASVPIPGNGFNGEPLPIANRTSGDHGQLTCSPLLRYGFGEEGAKNRNYLSNMRAHSQAKGYFPQPLIGYGHLCFPFFDWSGV
jgi:hypothetical protein